MKKVQEIIFTSDLHAHVWPYSEVIEGETVEVGGFEGLRALYWRKRKTNPHLLFVDGGDFSMGTRLQMIYTTQGADLCLLGALGAEVTTIGNHELDFHAKGLSRMMNAAVAAEEPLPEIVLCNLDWEGMESTQNAEIPALRRSFFHANARTYCVIQKGDVRIGITGVIGNDAISFAPDCGLKFKDPILSVRETVRELKEKESIDLLICLSHSGLDKDLRKSEDEQLAMAVPELDLIISGHTHTLLRQPIRHGSTSIVSCGNYGMYVGSVQMETTVDGRWRVKDYQLLRNEVLKECEAPIKDEDMIKDENQIKSRISSYERLADQEFETLMGIKAKEKIVTNPFHFSSVEELSASHREHTLGNLLADAFREEGRRYNRERLDSSSAVVAIVPAGMVRETFAKGILTAEEIFNSYSLGCGFDQKPGYPLLCVWLTGRELKWIAELDASLSDRMTSARLYFSGMSYRFHKKRPLLNRVTDLKVLTEAGNWVRLQNNGLYCVTADLYCGLMLNEVRKLSHGLIRIIPKDSSGKPQKDLSHYIIYRENKTECKGYQAILEYLLTISETGTDERQMYPGYASGDGRKIREHGCNPLKLLRSLNLVGAAQVLPVGMLLAVLSVIVFGRSRK